MPPALCLTEDHPAATAKRRELAQKAKSAVTEACIACHALARTQ